MDKIDPIRRQHLAARLERETQETVMSEISQFAQAEICTLCPPPAESHELRTLVFNMERGTNLEETVDFLRHCPDIQPFDILLANELDDGCARSGGRDVAREIAQALGMNYVFALEFVELADSGPKGFHGNALFSRWPIPWAETLHLPEAYNWYHDRQKRIGGRNAVLAKLDVGGTTIGVASVHLENRADGQGRLRQMQAVLAEADRVFAGIPVVLGGDLNTNTFDGQDAATVQALAASPLLQETHMAQVERFEPLLTACVQAGYQLSSGGSAPTRRKHMPEMEDLLLRLDWLVTRGLTLGEGRVVSTLTTDCGFAPAKSALARFSKSELSDHNAIWAALSL